MQSFLNDTFGEYLMTHPWFFLLIIWAAVWKGIALWKSARNSHLTIFIILCILNLFGIPEIIYLVYLYFKAKEKVSTNSQFRNENLST